MDSLEKLFLSCLVLFGMFILFLFGLYFDLGDMLASSLHRDERNATGVGITDHLIEKMEERARPREIMPTNLDLPRGGGGSSDGEEMAKQAMRALGRGTPPMSVKTIRQLKRASLIGQGIQREEILEMEELAADREEPSRVNRQVLQYAQQKEYGKAIAELQNAINRTDPKNLMVLREYLGLQVQLYLDNKDVEKAKESARKLYELLDKMMAIRSLGGATPAMEQEVARIKTEKERLDGIYQELQKRMEETGSPMGLTAAEKAQMKEAMTRARQSGSMSEEEYRRAIKELE